MFFLFKRPEYIDREKIAAENFLDLHKQISEYQHQAQVSIAWAQHCCKAISMFVPDARFIEDLDNRIRGKMRAVYPDFEEVLKDFYKPLKKRKTK